MRNVVDASNAIEFGNDAASWLDDTGNLVLERGLLFTKVKDAYDSMSNAAKRRVDKCLVMYKDVP